MSHSKICIIGAGSTVFAQNILSDVLSNRELADSKIALFDIDAERLSTSEIMATCEIMARRIVAHGNYLPAYS
jgi:alpha-galactosidase/6-phospho-beta-glucosidase family protein